MEWLGGFVLLLMGLAALTVAVMIGFALGISTSGPEDEELSAAYSRGCSDCRCRKPTG